MKNNEKKKNNVLIQFIHLAFKIDKQYFIPLICSCVVNALRGILGAYTISIIISFIEKGNYQNAILCGVVITAIEVLLAFLNKLVLRMRNVSLRVLNEKVSHVLTNKIMSLPFAYLEDQKCLELKNNAFFGIINMSAIDQFFNSFINIITNAITTITLVAIITTFNAYLLIAIIGAILLSLLVTLFNSKVLIKFYKDLIPINYKYGYYIDTLIMPAGQKDFRLFKPYEVILENYYTYCKFLFDKLNNINYKSGAFASLMALIQYSLIGIVYIVVGATTIRENLSISEFSLIVSSAIMFTTCAEAIINSSTSIMQATQYVTPIIEFMNMKEDKDEGDKELENIDSIRFDHVTFTYPNTTKKVLDDVSFVIHKNQKISIVGLNGAGKTTIVKLICRMYKPDSGSIKINDCDIYEYRYDSYMKKISSVFQDYKLFNYSIIDNIKPGMDELECERILEDVHLTEKMEELPKGVHSCIGKEYEEDGIDLSGGQKQRIAIARSIAKPADLLILDEPTSALDPIAEAEIYENFNALAKDRMAIYISHRMSSSIFCDKILVLNDGKVENFATHKELMSDPNSLYYELFTTQAKNYQLNKNE